jgi:hypothetical protein
MLVHSHRLDDGVPVIDLLPALPSHWPSGRIGGLRARGAITVEELSWRDGAVVGAAFVATADTTVEVRWHDRDREHRRRLILTAGERATLGELRRDRGARHPE